MADEPTASPEQAAPAPSTSAPSTARKAIGSTVLVLFLLFFGGGAYFVITYLGSNLLEELPPSVLGLLTFGALVVGLIVGGVIGARAKQAILR